MSLEDSVVGETNEAIVLPVQPPQIEIREERYSVRFAQTQEELLATLKLRFEIFNLELEEGLDESFQTGRDQDEFDATCHHLVIVETETNNIVGTYRLQTKETALQGFY